MNVKTIVEYFVIEESECQMCHKLFPNSQIIISGENPDGSDYELCTECWEK